MLPSLDRLKEFWKLQRAHPQYQSHPVLQSCPNFDQKMLPLAFHGDGTPVIGIGKIWSRQLTIFSWNSLLGFGMTREMQLHIWSFFDECSGPATLDEFFTILSWSFAALQTGKWPETNHLGQNYDPDSHEGKLAGTLLADGFSAIVWSLVGDCRMSANWLSLQWKPTEPLGSSQFGRICFFNSFVLQLFFL